MQMLMIGSCCYLFGPINSCIIQPITRIVVSLIWSTGEYKSRRLNVKAIISKWLSVFSSALSVAVHIPFSIALNKCVVCNGNKRECSCPERPPPQKKQKKQSSSQPSKQSSAVSSSYKELRKLYDNLQKEHERVGTAFQNHQKQQEELEKELDEAIKDAEELANLVTTKSEAIKTLILIWLIIWEGLGQSYKLQIEGDWGEVIHYKIADGATIVERERKSQWRLCLRK